MSKSKWKVVESLIKELNADILRSNLEGSVPFLIGLRCATPLSYTVLHDVFYSAFEKNWMDELIYLLQIDQGKLKTLQSTQLTLLILPVTENGDKELMVLFLKQDISIMYTDACLADGVIPCCTTIIARDIFSSCIRPQYMYL